MDGNILSGGLNELNIIRDCVSELNRYRDSVDELALKETKLEKSLKSREKDIADEIAGTIRKRKDEIEGTYNAQSEKTRQRIKKIRTKKEKSKSAKVSERIDSETSGLREEHRLMVQEIKEIFRLNKIPFLFNNRIFYALFMPKGMADFIIIITLLLLVLLALPYGLYTLIMPGLKMIFLFVEYLLIVFLFGGGYMLIDNNVKAKHNKAFTRINQVRGMLAVNRKRRNDIKKRILKDKDESVYGLEDYDQELLELEEELENITASKKDAMTTFENSTKLVIKEEITQRYQEELNNLKNDYATIYAQIREMEEKIKEMSMNIVSNYEAYLGKEFMTIDKLDMLAEIMNSNSLSTISEAINFYKGESN